MKNKLKDVLYFGLVCMLGINLGWMSYSYFNPTQYTIGYVSALSEVAHGYAEFRDSDLILYPENRDSIIRIIIKKENIHYEE